MTSPVKSKKKIKKLTCTKTWLKKWKNRQMKKENQLCKSNLTWVSLNSNTHKLILPWTTLTVKDQLLNFQNKRAEVALELQAQRALELAEEEQFLNHQGNKPGRCQVTKSIWIYQVFLRSPVTCLSKLVAQTENTLEAEWTPKAANKPFQICLNLGLSNKVHFKKKKVEEL